MCNAICVTRVYLGEVTNIFFVCQMSGLVEKTFSIRIYTATINVISVKFCMMVLLIELYLFILLSVTLTIFQGHSIVEQS